MDTKQDKLHALDLQQIEWITKLQARLADDLKTYNQLVHLTALAEAKQDRERVGIALDQPVTDEQIETLLQQQEKILLAAKAGIFNTNNTLKQLHDKRQVVIAQAREQEELAEETA
tara:strand:- start:283 stop:630 length:348 start_codon:yes stop_codon:yes gene_type:complete